ncbi:DNA polymerase IV [Frateuria aurantia]
MRKVLHIDMDAFYASVEQRDDPALRGRPVVVAWKGPRSVVCAASYEARRFGIHSAMPAMRAERLCPSAVFVPPDFARYKEVSRQIREIFLRHTDLVEPLSLDEAYLDVTSNKLGIASATEIADLIRRAIRDETGLTASAGVASNKFLAKIASDWNKPDGIYVVKPTQAMAFLAVLPVGRLPGVGKVMQSRLHDLGIQRVEHLRSIPVTVLEQRFGRWGLRLHQLSMGIDESPVRPQRTPKQISNETTFPADLQLDELEPHLHRLAERTWAAAVRQSMLTGHTITLKLKTHDFVNLSRSITLTTAPHSAEDIVGAVLQLLTRVAPVAGIRYRLAGIGLSGFRSLQNGAIQGDLFAAGGNSNAGSVDR